MNVSITFLFIVFYNIAQCRVSIHTMCITSNYASFSSRCETFRDWPRHRSKPEALARAGFFYLRDSDRVKCFTCNIEIIQWRPEFIPLLEHLYWSPGCAFAQSVPQPREGFDTVY